MNKLILNKIHQYVKDRALDPKYACAFLLDNTSQQADIEEVKGTSDYNWFIFQNHFYFFLHSLATCLCDAQKEMQVKLFHFSDELVYVVLFLWK